VFIHFPDPNARLPIHCACVRRFRSQVMSKCRVHWRRLPCYNGASLIERCMAFSLRWCFPCAARCRSISLYIKVFTGTSPVHHPVLNTLTTLMYMTCFLDMTCNQVFGSRLFWRAVLDPMSFIQYVHVYRRDWTTIMASQYEMNGVYTNG